MAYTNKTPNLELPQYVGTDKPTYLVDFNSAMSTIDSAVHTNSVNIENANTNLEILSEKVDDNKEYFNLNTFTTISGTEMSLSNNTATVVAESQLTLATNSDNTLFKLYGKIDVNVNQVTGSLTLSFNTRLRPTNAININDAYIAVLFNTSGNIYSIQTFRMSIATNGVVSMKIGTGSTTILQSCILQPCLYFLKDFED